MGVQISLQASALRSSGYILRREKWGHMAPLYLIFEEPRDFYIWFSSLLASVAPLGQATLSLLGRSPALGPRLPVQPQPGSEDPHFSSH